LPGCRFARDRSAQMYALAERGHGRANLDRHQESRKTVEEFSFRTIGAFTEASAMSPSVAGGYRPHTDHNGPKASAGAEITTTCLVPGSYPIVSFRSRWLETKI
jgi:hypothetical protein